jgi:hypothetical protein
LEWSYSGPENIPTDMNSRRLRIARKDIDGILDPSLTIPAPEGSITGEAKNVTSDDETRASKERESEERVMGGVQVGEIRPVLFPRFERRFSDLRRYRDL